MAWAQTNSKGSNGIEFPDQFAGADACVKTQNAIAALPSNGGEVDGRGLTGFQTCSVNPFAKILNHPGESVHLYLPAGSTFITMAQWRIPTSSIVTGGGVAADVGGRGTSIIAASGFAQNSPVIYLGDVASSAGALIENLTVNCNHVAGCVGIFSDQVEEMGGVRQVSVINFPAAGVEMLDRSQLPPGTGGQPENYILDELNLMGDPGSTCLVIRVGQGGQRGGGRVTCTSDAVVAANLSCAGGVVTASLPNHSITNGARIGVESGSDLSFGGVFVVTSSSAGQVQWSQPGCRGGSSGALLSPLIESGVLLDGADGSYSQIHCEFTVDCVLLGSVKLPNGWPTRALTISAVSGQSSVSNLVHVALAGQPEDIVLTALERCIGPRASTEGCATNVLRDDLNSLTLQDASIGWYVIGHSTRGAAAALLSSSPGVGWVLPAPAITFGNRLTFEQLGRQLDGTLTYCPDCKVVEPSACSTAKPAACACAAGGAGAFARRVEGSWMCN